ncbi:MAG: hypothetical protein WC511_07270 [Candidatus Pacearchaeota archaeon]
MERNKTHNEHLEKWAMFVKNNPAKWKKEHTLFIDAQIIKSWDFYNKLKQTANGREKIKLLRGINLLFTTAK